MSSALDEDTRRTIDEGRRTAGAMLRAAQQDLQKVFIVFLVGFLGAFYALSYAVWPFLKDVTKARMEGVLGEEVQIIAQTPFDVILLQAKISLVVGVIVCLPAFIYYSRDALRVRGMWPSSPVEPWKAVLIGVLSVLLFLAGLAYGYLFFFPVMFEFLAGNALSAGFKPTYSIVKWAQFIFLLTLSFGLAAQMPLAITGLSYSGIVQYETFRDKWRYAVVLIFVFGALFSPPDPFTQIMWAVPLLFLYGFSLYLAKVVVTAKRGSEQIDVWATTRDRWNLVAGSGVLGFVVVYAFYTRGGVELVNSLLASVSDYRVVGAGGTLPLSATAETAVFGVVGALLFALGAVMYFVYNGIVATDQAETGTPAGIDISILDAAGVRAAPPEAFEEMTEPQALELANEAMDEGDKEKARVILDRFDEAESEREAGADADGAAAEADSDAEGGTAEEIPGVADDIGDRAGRAGESFFSALSDDDEEDEDDIGGYYTDIQFILDSLTSRAFWLVAIFMVTLAVTFTGLYLGGLAIVFDNFTSRLPPQLQDGQFLTVVALHPVEALIFQVKFSTVIAAIATAPFVGYFAWPALRERNIVRGNRNVIFGWIAALAAGLIGGFVLGYLYIAPTVISYLVADAVQADMLIRYRITNFFWLIFFMTAGIGLLADIPVLMVLLNTAGVSYRAMRGRWREVTVGILTFAALFTPASISTMLLATIPMMAAYGTGLGILWLVTFGGRRNLAPSRTETGGEAQAAD
ncbi:twin-arginine translocase subunit TatC [Salinirubrum litoreum]|uniref:Sec-independent protein translocase protein TatC n=1 Tax=Salinirubrum litoreum TaxID=1126234 RepID=A0ABD5R5X0_9EURY|nr:twin-arginine translocase subunit TatC [Salinirubrum litoreum]